MHPDLIAGRYRVVRAVGHGGMGTVWLCRDEVLGRQVALKQIGMLPGESAPDAARALREARSSAALNHDHVVSVFDVVDDDRGQAWLVMEYVPSLTLGQVVQQEGPLAPRRAARIAAQVADGLAAAHARGVIHRDVKPGNVLVGEGDHAKITDFGIARRHGDDHLTRTGLVTGTPSYFSPELARGEEPGPEADVYALGATLYFAVEGRTPYPAQRNPIALLQRIAAEDPPPPQHAGPLSTPIAAMMARDTHTRWSMTEAAAALRRLADRGAADVEDHEPTSVLWLPPAASDSRGGPGTAPSGARRAPWLAAAAVLVPALLGAGYLVLAEDPPSQAGGDPATAPAPEQTEAPSAPAPEPTGSGSAPAASPQSGEVEEDIPGDPATAVEDYFTLVPGDTDAGWSRLAPSMQDEVGRASYRGWWGSVDAVEVHSTRTVGHGRVRVDLTYAMADGSATRETQLLTLVRGEPGWLIADDEVLSSRPA